MVKATYNIVQNPDAELPTVVYPPGTEVYTEANVGDAVTWEEEYNELTK